MRLSPSGARSAAAILFDNSMCLPVADGIEVLRSKYVGLLGQFTIVKTEFKEIVHLWRLVSNPNGGTVLLRVRNRFAS